jgi:hypothetical protein
MKEQAKALSPTLPQDRQAKTHKAQTRHTKFDLRAITRAANAHNSAQTSKLNAAGYRLRILFLETSCRAQFAGHETLEAGIEASLKIIFKAERGGIHRSSGGSPFEVPDCICYVASSTVDMDGR